MPEPGWLNSNKGKTREHLVKQMRDLVGEIFYYRAQYGDRPWVDDMDAELNQIWERRLRRMSYNVSR
jgi:hypothetical protein